jgi:hypothetical protein
MKKTVLKGENNTRPTTMNTADKSAGEWDGTQELGFEHNRSSRSFKDVPWQIWVVFRIPFLLPSVCITE